MKAQEIVDYVFEIAPEPDWAWDNHFEFGDGDLEVHGIAVAWWITSDMLTNMAAEGLNFGLTHETTKYEMPKVFRWGPMIADDELLANRRIRQLAEENTIAVHRFHSNIDLADWGMPHALLKQFGWSHYGAVITTPNHLHTEPAIECMRRGIALALEKPIAESAENCRRLLEAKRKHAARVVIGFVMRSTPFYLQARKWIEDGRIGEVVSIQADEIPNVLTTSVMFRSDWRRFQATSGGSLLEKCCHDIDMLTWLAGGSPQRINSFAGVKALAPRADVPLRCDACPLQERCVYYLPPTKYDHPDQINKANDGLLYKFTRDNSACIYNNGHDIYDHQTVQIEYRNGVHANFILDFSAAGRSCGRTLKVLGTSGAIYGKLEENVIFLHNHLSDATEEAQLYDDGSGHAGSNRNHTDSFLHLMGEPDFKPSATLEAGYLSAMLCFAADQSVAEHQQIDVSHLLAEAGLHTA